MFYHFKSFQPISDVAPIAFGWHGNDIVGRARAVLHERSTAEIEAAIHLVNWLLDSAWVEEACDELGNALSRWLGAEVDNENSEWGALANAHARNTDSSCFCLSLCVGHFDLSTYTALPEAAWYELFAALSLGIIDRAIADEDFYDGLPVQSEFHHLWRSQARVADWLIEAMDAIATAEGLLKLARLGLSGHGKERAPLVPSIADAEVRTHAAEVDVLLDLFEYYRSGHFGSCEQAIERFSQTHGDKVAGVSGDVGLLHTKLARLVRGK